MIMRRIKTAAPSIEEPFRVTAVAASGHILCIVTMNWTVRSVQLAPTGCLTLPFSKTDLYSEDFSAKLESFLTSKRIRVVAIRRGAYTGRQCASQQALQIEALLETMQGIDTHRVRTASVSGWLLRRQWMLPLPQKGLGASELKTQRRAIEAAGFVIAQVLDQRLQRMPAPGKLAAETTVRRCPFAPIEVQP